MGRLGLALGRFAIPVLGGGEIAVLARHEGGGGGEADEGEAYLLPHQIDHARNMRRLVEAGCDRVLAIGSAGGLRPELAPGTFVCPDDFIALDLAPTTALDGFAAHRVPGFDTGWRNRVLAAFSATGREEGIELRDAGVYWQVSGPRLETPAEVRLIAQHADIVGMTIASECIAAGELGLRYAAVCVIDNLANGIAGDELSLGDLEAGRARNRETLGRVLAVALEELG